jgi:hypothetical protein
MNSNDSFTQVILFDQNNNDHSLTLCLQSLVANTNQLLQVDVYTNQTKEIVDDIKNNLFIKENKNFNFHETNKLNYWKVLSNSISKSNKKFFDLVLLTDRAIVTSGWLSAMKEATTKRDDIAIVISREIRHKSDREAWDLVPYAMNSYDIDVALSPNKDFQINLCFNEEHALIALSKFNLFCSYFSNNFFNQINWKNYSSLTNCDFVNQLSNLVRENNQYIVYTPKSKIYNANYFY